MQGSDGLSVPEKTVQSWQLSPNSILPQAMHALRCSP